MRVTKRHVLRTGVAGAATLLLPFRAPQARPKPDTIRLAVAASSPRSLDPRQDLQGQDLWGKEQVFEPLVRGPDGAWAMRDSEFVPALAESWEGSDGARKWTFKLRRGVQFHKGYGEMTSEDVAYTMEKARASSYAGVMYSNVESIQATAPYEVVVTLKNSDPLFLNGCITSTPSYITSKKAEQERPDRSAKDPIGTGPYQLTQLDSRSGVQLTRFDKYWGGPAKVKDVEIVYIADSTARTFALIAGDVDMIEAVRAPGWIPQVMQQKPGLLLDMPRPGSLQTLHFNLEKKPLDNLLVRQAIMHSIDRKRIAEALAPMGAPTYTMAPPGYPAGSRLEELPEELRYAYDPDRSRKLLAQAGYPNGVRVSTVASQREDYRSSMLILQDQLRAGGINIDFNIIDHASYRETISKGQTSLVLMSYGLHPPVPTDWLMRYVWSGANTKSDGSGTFNYSHYGVAMPGVDSLLQEMQEASSSDRYLELGRQIEMKVLRDLPVIGLITLGFAVIRSPRVNLGYDVAGGPSGWRLHRATIVG